MKISVYIATSLDGFIARENGDLDWLPGAVEVETIGSMDKIVAFSSQNPPFIERM